ncbi:DMT family transporter [Candidatus Woesearchaeota archaeon]|nr:DMT family transporter [Candidatus Woesearchaeota archaeon]
MNRHIKGSALIIAAMVLFGLVGTFVRLINIRPALLIFASTLLITIVLLIYYIISRRVKELLGKKLMWLYVLTGLFLIGNLYSYLKAYALTTFANSVFSHYMAPVIAALSAPLIVDEKIEKVTIKALVISVMGLILISYSNLSFGSMHLKGIMFGLVSAIFYGLSINIVKRLLNNDATALSILFYQSLIPCIVMVPFLGIGSFIVIKEKITLIASYTLFATFVPTLMFLSGVRHVKAQHTGILAYSEVISAILFGFLLFKEVPSLMTIIGGALILFSGYLIIRVQSDS